MILFCRMLYLHGVWDSSRYTKQRNKQKRALNPPRGCLAVRQTVLQSDKPSFFKSRQRELNDRFLNL